VPAHRRLVVVNRVRASASGPRPAAAIGAALHRYAGVVAPHLLPEDQLACDAAMLSARTLVEHEPSGRLAAAITALADRLTVLSRNPTAGARVVLAPDAPAGAH